MLEFPFRNEPTTSLLFFLTCLCVSCDNSVGIPPATQPTRVVEWDFSDCDDISRIKTPWTSPGEVQYVYGNTRLKIKVRAGLSGELDVEMIQVWRDDKRIRGISLFTAAGTVEDVYTTAMHLADMWQIKDRNNLERFRRTSGRTLMSQESAIVQDQLDPIQPRGIDIRPSFEPNEKKWIAILRIGLPALTQPK